MIFFGNPDACLGSVSHHSGQKWGYSQCFDSLTLATFEQFCYDFLPNWYCLSHIVIFFGNPDAQQRFSEYPL